METQKSTKKYAIISKSECCVGWKTSFRAILHTDEEGRVQEPDWRAWSGSDNLADPYPTDDYIAGLLENLENEPGHEGYVQEKIEVAKKILVAAGSAWVAEDYASGEIRFYADQEGSIADLWEFGKCNDWNLEILTADEAAREVAEAGYPTAESAMEQEPAGTRIYALAEISAYFI